MSSFKYVGASLLVLAITVLTAVNGVPNWKDPAAVAQFATLAVQALVVFGAGLAAGKWAGKFKVGGAVALAIISAVIPLFSPGGFNANNVVLVILAGLNALAAQVGVTLRVSPEPNLSDRDRGLIRRVV